MYIGEVPPRTVYRKNNKKIIHVNEQNDCIICKNTTHSFYLIQSSQKFICDGCANSILSQRISYLTKLK